MNIFKRFTVISLLTLLIAFFGFHDDAQASRRRYRRRHSRHCCLHKKNRRRFRKKPRIGFSLFGLNKRRKPRVGFSLGFDSGNGFDFSFDTEPEPVLIPQHRIVRVCHPTLFAYDVVETIEYID